MAYKLQLRSYASADFPMTEKGNSVPPWLIGNGTAQWKIGETNTWYKTAGNENMSYYINVVDNETAFIQYGQNVPYWASARFWSEAVTLSNEQPQPDGSIKVHVSVKPRFFAGRQNDFSSAGFPVEYTIKVHGQTVYTFNGNTIDSFTQGSKDPVDFDITVKPQETYKGSAFEINVHYPGGQFKDNQTIVGITIYNPTPPTYRPFAIRKSGAFKDLNSNSGFIKIRKSGTYQDKSQENASTIRAVDTGHNRIRSGGKWKQAPPMNGGTA